MIREFHQAIQKASTLDELIVLAVRWRDVCSPRARVYVSVERLSAYVYPLGVLPIRRDIVPVETFVPIEDYSPRSQRRLAKVVAARDEAV